MKATLISAVTAIVLLFSLPFLFRKPATTLRRPQEIARLAAEIAQEDPIWMSGEAVFSFPVPPAGTVALGSHSIYPYDIQTIRDQRSGDVLVVISFGFEGPEYGRHLDEEQSMIYLEDRVVILVKGDSTASWPAELFSVISNG